MCGINGTITTVNDCLANWLQYPTSQALVGKRVSRDLLDCLDDWHAWRSVSGDLAALLQQSVAVKTRNQQLLWMNVEVFAASDSPTSLLAMFADQTEVALLGGKNASD